MSLTAAYTTSLETNRIRSMPSIRSPYWLFVVLILLLGGLQYRLWVGEGSLAQALAVACEPTGPSNICSWQEGPSSSTPWIAF